MAYRSLLAPQSRLLLAQWYLQLFFGRCAPSRGSSEPDEAISQFPRTHRGRVFLLRKNARRTRRELSSVRRCLTKCEIGRGGFVRSWEWPIVRTGILIGMLALMALEGNTSCHGMSAETFSNIYLAVHAIRVNCNVPTSFENAISDPDATAITLDLHANDVARVFDNLVQQRSAYKWGVEDGVYDLYPKAKTERLSGLIVKVFVLEEATHTQALVALDKLTEVQKWHSRHHEYGGVLISQSGFRRTEPRISLVLRNVPIREILNKLSLNFESLSQEPEWSIVHYGEGNKHSNISF